MLVLGDLVGYGAEPNAVIDRSGSLRSAGRDPRQPRQSRLRDRRWQQLQPRGARGRRVDGRSTDPGEPRVSPGAARRPVSASTTLTEICHGSPFDEDHYIFDTDDAARALDATRQAAVPLRSHPSASRVLPGSAGRRWLCAGRESNVDLRSGRREVSDQPRFGGTAARRRPARRFHGMDTERRAASLLRVPYPVDLAQRRILSAGLPPAWPTASPSGANPGLRGWRSWTRLFVTQRSFLAPLQLRRKRVPRGTRTEDPADHDPTSSTAGMKMKCADVMLEKFTAGLRRRPAG